VEDVFGYRAPIHRLQGHAPSMTEQRPEVKWSDQLAPSLDGELRVDGVGRVVGERAHRGAGDAELAVGHAGPSLPDGARPETAGESVEPGDLHRLRGHLRLGVEHRGESG